LEKDNNYYSDLAEKAVYDESAFSELYEKYFRVVYNLVYVRVKNTVTADDLTSEIFLKMTQNLSKFDKTRASFSTWISRITERTCIDFFRSYGKHEKVEWDDVFSPPIPEHEQPEQKIILSEDKQILMKAVSKLSEREQRIIELKFWADMSNKEIGEVLGISAGNVGIILFRAMGTLRQKLQKKIL